jgi:zinc protease
MPSPLKSCGASLWTAPDAVAGAKDYPSARFAASIVLSSGVGSLERQALGKALTGTVANVQPWIDEQNEGLSGSASPQDVETMLSLMHLYVTAPRRDEGAFASFRAALREALRNRDLNPLQVFSDAVASEQWGNHPRRLPPTLLRPRANRFRCTCAMRSRL